MSSAIKRINSSTFSGNPSVSVPFIASMYLLAGASVITAIIPAFANFKSIHGLVATIATTFVLSLAGMILALMRQSCGTNNRNKLLAYFAIMMAAMLFFGIALIIMALANFTSRDFGRGNAAIHVYFHMAVCSALVGQVLVVVCGIIILAMASSREQFPDCPKLNEAAKILIGIPCILASIGAIVRIFLTSENWIGIIQIICSGLMGVGFLLGICIGFFSRSNLHELAPKTEPIVMVQSSSAIAPGP